MNRILGLRPAAWALSCALPLLVGCKTKYQCQQYDLTVCANNPIQVTACTGQNSNSQDIVTVISNPPDYLDVAPMNSEYLGFFLPGVQVDKSMLTNPTGTPLTVKNPPNIPDAYGTGEKYYDSVGYIQSDNGYATGVLVDPRVVITSAHGLLPKFDPTKDGLGADLSKEVYSFTIDIPAYSTSMPGQTVFDAGGLKTSKGWAVIHPGYDPITRELDIAIIVLNSPIPSAWRVPYATLPSMTPELDVGCACPINPTDTVVIGWGESGNDGDQPPNLLQNPSSFNFPIAAGQAEKLTVAEIEAVNQPRLADISDKNSAYYPPSVDLISSALFEGDRGAPVFLNNSPGGNPVGLPLFAIYSSPSSVNTRHATVLTSTIVNWIKSTMLKTMAPYPPIGWNGYGNQTHNSSYAFTNPENWSLTPPPVPNLTMKHPGDHGTEVTPAGGGTEDGMDWQACEAAPPTAPRLNINQFSRVIILGDSLTDQTNQYALIGTGYTPNPNAGYWNGRFTNGYNWLDYFELDNLWNGSSLTMPVLNKAVGGAFASQLGKEVALHNAGGIAYYLTDGARPTIVDEVKGTHWLSGLSDHDIEDALVIIWAGGNDVNEAALDCPIGGVENSTPDQPNAIDLANAIENDIGEVTQYLIEKKAKEILFANVPPTYLTPTALDTSLPGDSGYNPDGVDYARAVATKVNTDLQAWVSEQAQAGRPQFAPAVVDVQAFLEGWNGGNPSSINMYQTNYACRNVDILGNVAGQHGNPKYFPQPYKDEPCLGYLFFDTLHPTTMAHCGVAQLMEQTFTQNGITVTVDGSKAFEDTCPERVQTNAYQIPTQPNINARAIRFYKQTPALSQASFGRACAENTCPNGFYWDTNGTDLLVTSAVPFNDPAWFDINSIPGGASQAGTGAGALATGWAQPVSTQGQAGACRCAPLEDPALATACNGTCSTPAEVISRIYATPPCNNAAFWSGRTNNLGIMTFAAAAARSQNAWTLEGYAIDGSNGLVMPQYGRSPAGRSLWHWASYIWASAACPNPEPLLIIGNSLRENTVWRTTECYSLQDQGITKVKYLVVQDPNADGSSTPSSAFTECPLDCTNAPTGLNAACAPNVQSVPDPNFRFGDGSRDDKWDPDPIQSDRDDIWE